jgi:hypothetical protein
VIEISDSFPIDFKVNFLNARLSFCFTAVDRSNGADPDFDNGRMPLD